MQACGDAHLMNFGGFATPERNVIFDNIFPKLVFWLPELLYSR